MKHSGIINKMIVHAMLALYLYVLCKVILFKFRPIEPAYLQEQLIRSLQSPGNVVRRISQGNLIPFKEISDAINHVSVHGLINLIGNVAIFIPLGMLLGLPAIGRRLSYGGACLLSLGVSLCLEGAQAVFAMGYFDVDDLILNAGGGLIGFIACRLSARLAELVSGYSAASARSLESGEIGRAGTSDA